MVGTRTRAVTGLRPTPRWAGQPTTESFLAHPAPALWAASGMLALVVLIALLIPAEPLDLDRSWSQAMHHLETPLLTELALVFNWLGRGLGRVIALTLVGLLLLRARRWLALVAFAIAESLAPLLSTLLKALVNRTRPPDGLVHPVGASFPSGHATYAGATCVALVLLFTTPGPHRRWWWTLASLGVVGMAWSRTYLQVHWLTDVIAGALLGSGISLLVFVIAQQHDRQLPAGPGRIQRRGTSPHGLGRSQANWVVATAVPGLLMGEGEGPRTWYRTWYRAQRISLDVSVLKRGRNQASVTNRAFVVRPSKPVRSGNPQAG